MWKNVSVAVGVEFLWAISNPKQFLSVLPGLSSWRASQPPEGLWTLHWVPWALRLALSGLHGHVTASAALVLYRVVLWKEEVRPHACVHTKSHIHSLTLTHTHTLCFHKVKNNLVSSHLNRVKQDPSVNLVACKSNSVCIRTTCSRCYTSIYLAVPDWRCHKMISELSIVLFTW